MKLADDQLVELRALVNSRDVPATVATRARIVLWRAEGKRRKDIAELAVVSLPTVDRWLDRYAQHGLPGLDDRLRGAARRQVPSWVPGRLLALSRATPLTATGLSHWSARTLAAYFTAHEGASVSWHYVAKLWRANDLRPHKHGTFKLFKDPAFAAKTAERGVTT